MLSLALLVSISGALAEHYCRPMAVPDAFRTGDGTDEALSSLLYDLPAVSGGGITNWNVGTESWGGATYYKATFTFRPYEYQPRQGSDLRNYFIDFIVHQYPATCYVNSDKDEIQNGFLYFNQHATSNGLPASGSGDPTHTSQQLPACWFGTDTMANHEHTYACKMTGEFGMVSCFWDVVPDKIRFQSWLRGKLVEAHELITPWDDCDDHSCDGQYWDPPGYPPYENVIGVPSGGAGDGEIHTCLATAAMIKFDGENQDRIRYLDNIYVYSVALKRFITEVEAKFNSDNVLKALVSPPGSWSFAKLLHMGGSKRGRATIGSFLSMPTLNDGYPPTSVVSFAGHCYGDYGMRVYQQKDKYFFNQSRPCHADAHGMYNWMQGEYGYRRDSFSSVVAQTADYLDGRQIVYAGGMQDTYFMPTVTNAFVAAIPSSFRMLLVPNVGHGGGWVDYLEGASCWAAKAAFGTSYLMIDAEWELDANKVYADISNGSPDDVEIWCTTSQHSKNYPSHCTDNATCNALPSNTRWDPPDLTSSVWTKVDMTYSGGRWQATPPQGSGAYATWQACFARAIDYGVCAVTSPILLNYNLCEFDPSSEISTT